MTSPSEPTSIRRGYKTADGKRCPGVTTVIGVLDKPALLTWASRAAIDAVEQAIANLGDGEPLTSAALDELRKTPPYELLRDKAADSGTYAHAIVAARLKEQEDPDPPLVMLEEDVKAAKLCAARAVDWIRKAGMKIVAVEEAMVSERWRVGGTPDLIAVVNGTLAVVDLKTGKRAYDEVIIQLAAYASIWRETHPESPEITRGVVLSCPVALPVVEPTELSAAALKDGAVMFDHLVAVYRSRQALTLKKAAQPLVIETAGAA